MLDIPCIIFAGGKSSRMGEDKALLPFPPYKTLLYYQHQRLKKIFKFVYISTKNRDKFDFEADIIEDISDEDTFAPTVGFVSAFKVLKADKIFVISVDSPFVSKEIIYAILNSYDESYDAIVAKTLNHIEPMCGLYSRKLENDFISMLKISNHKLYFLLQKSKTKYISFLNQELFFNINTKEDYYNALNIYKRTLKIKKI